MLREALRHLLRLLIFVDFRVRCCILLFGVRQTFFRAGEYWDRSGSLFSPEGRCLVNSQRSITLRGVDQCGWPLRSWRCSR